MNDAWQYFLTLLGGIALGLLISPFARSAAAVRTSTGRPRLCRLPQHLSAEALRDCDERFRAAFDTTAVGMAIVDRDGTFLEVNAALCNFLGYSEAELVGRRFQEITYPEDLLHNLELFDRLMQGELSYYHLEKRYVHSQGHLVWGLLSVVLVRDAQGQPFYEVAQVQDISERKRAEQTLQEREALLRSISNNIPRGVLYQLVHDPRENSLAFSYISAGIQDLLGVSAEAVMQNASIFYDLLLAEDREKVDRLTRLSLEQLTDFEVQVQQRSLQGDIIWSTVRAVPRRLANGCTVWDGVAIDITSLKEAETALRQREAQMRAVLQAIPDLVLRANRQGEGLAYHNGGQVLLLSSIKERASVFDVLPEAIARDRLRCIQQALDTRELQTHEYELHSDGTVHYEEARIVASGPDEVVVFVRDITAAKRREALRQQYELELKQAKEAAEAANQAKSTFLSHFSHELRSPLNTLLGYAQLLARNSNLTSMQRAYLETLNRSGNHLSQIIDDVLSLARIEAGRVSVKPSPVHLPDLLRNLQAIYQLRAASQGLQLTLSMADDLPAWIETDEGKLRQILINLLDNAIKFTPQGSIRLRAWLDAAAPVLQFAVSDTGVGIAPQDLPLIFEAFVQTESGEQSDQGSGLGLAITARLVQMLGGEIRAESQLGQGTTLRFTLPYVPVSNPVLDKAETAEADPYAGKLVELASDQPSYRILVVDDIAINADMAAQWLTLIGFETQTALSGAAAIEEWQKFSPDLIWMDLRMPGINGLEATARIRSLELSAPPSPQDCQSPAQPRRTKIIAVSATVFEEERQRAFAAGCDDFVAKPYSETVLLQTLQRHLGVHYRCDTALTLAIAPDSGGLLTASSSPACELQPADFQVMSPEWIAQINWAARAAREELIEQLLGQIPAEHESLRQAIAALVERLQFEQLIHLTESLC